MAEERKKKKKKDVIDPPCNWSDIKHFFIWHDRFWGKSYIVQIDREGQAFLEPGNEKRLYEKYGDSWKKWAGSIDVEKENCEFAYPIWSIIKDFKDWHKSSVAVIGGVSLCVSIFLLFPFTGAVSLREQWILGMALVASVAVALFIIRKGRQFNKIVPIDDILEVSFTDGTKRKLSLVDVKRFGLDINLYSAFLVFNDGTKLVHLERVSYWPLLREHLLSKLGTNQTG